MLKHFNIFDKEIRFTLRDHNAMVSPGGDENDTWTKDNRIKKITESIKKQRRSKILSNFGTSLPIPDSRFQF